MAATKTNEYVNLFAHYGYANDEIQARMKDIYERIFYGEEGEKFYYNVGDDMGFVTDTGNADVRSEGQSYAMMAAVQMDDKDIFDRIWKWTKTYMWMDYGVHAGYFAWSVGLDGTKNAHGPAPDGEEFMAMALFFAAHRWGDGEGIFNYSEQAREILHHCLHNEHPMWNPENKLIKFVPEMEISDPSYHVPCFYDLFAQWANEQDRPFWKEAAEASRNYLPTACHPVTGLNPEYAHYDGTPVTNIRHHKHFFSDAYRVALNIGLDHVWAGPTKALSEAMQRQQNFLAANPELAHWMLEIDGTKTDTPCLHPVGLIATNAAASLATTGEIAEAAVRKFWETPLRTGERRYYDNFLYLFSFMALSGNYRIWDKAEETLGKKYKDSFLMGNIYTPNFLKNESLANHITAHFNTITAENIMKPMLIQPVRGEYQWQAADDMMAFAAKHNLTVIGHTLAWHQQSLKWVDETATSREEAMNILKEHITQIMSRYKGKIHAWDVLNEAFEDGVESDTKAWRSHLRSTPWLRMIGDDYIEFVFRTAHEIDPEAILYYNDYNLNYEQKREATYYMVKELREKGVPIHGIGEQGHYHTNTPIETIRDSIALFATIPGIEISITELDVTVTGSEKSVALSEAHEIEQAQYYAQLFKIYDEYKHVIKRITFWGTDDATSWRRERFPTLFNGDYSNKLAFAAVMDPDGFLTAYPLQVRNTQQEAIAVYGTPDFADISSWDTSEPLTVNRQLTAWEGATGVAYVMQDEENLYVRVDVTKKNPHDKDAVDIFINDQRISVTFADSELTHRTETGFIVQTELPLTSPIAGFDLQVSDYNEQGQKQSAAAWNDVTGMQAKALQNLGKLKFLKGTNDKAS